MSWLRLPTEKTPAKAWNIFRETSKTVATYSITLSAEMSKYLQYSNSRSKIMKCEILHFVFGVVFGCRRHVWGVQKRARKALRWSRIKIGSTLDFPKSEISWNFQDVPFWISRGCIDTLGPLPRTSSLKRFLAFAGDFSVGRRSQGMGRAVLKV